jgi:predicted acyl esterase
MGGAMAMQMFGALFVHAHDAQELRNDPAGRERIFSAMEHMRELVGATPFKPGHTPLAAVPNLEQVLFDYYYRGAYDEFWAREYNDFKRYFDRHADVPATFSGGWYDLFAIATPRYFNTMRAQNSSPQRLIMGPWNHTGMRAGISFAGDVDYGAQGTWGLDKYFAEQLRFFERWLKGIENDIEREAPVKLFVMGGGDGTRTRLGKLNHGGKWRDEQEFPLARTEYVRFYLGADGSLTSNDKAEESVGRTFTFDPTHPVPTLGASCSGFIELVPLSDKLDPFWSKHVAPPLRFNSIVLEGGTHQKEEPGIVGARPPYLTLDTRSDILVFQTEPLSEDVEITGFITVKLWVTSSAVDTDFTAKLIDVYPPNRDYADGYHLNLTDSILRLRFRNGFDREEFLTPGEIVPLTLELAPTSNLFQKGHRIRLDISGSNFPRFDVNPNTGEPMGRHTHMVAAHNTVYCGGEYASYVILPVIPQV